MAKSEGQQTKPLIYIVWNSCRKRFLKSPSVKPIDGLVPLGEPVLLKDRFDDIPLSEKIKKMAPQFARAYCVGTDKMSFIDSRGNVENYRPVQFYGLEENYVGRLKELDRELGSEMAENEGCKESFGFKRSRIALRRRFPEIDFEQGE